jgi:hypothetical protein
MQEYNLIHIAMCCSDELLFRGTDASVPTAPPLVNTPTWIPLSLDPRDVCRPTVLPLHHTAVTKLISTWVLNSRYEV